MGILRAKARQSLGLEIEPEVSLHSTETTGLDYQSYLLRFWRNAGDKLWRASLQSVATEETFRFANVGALFMFLETQLDESQDIAVDDSKDETE